MVQETRMKESRERGVKKHKKMREGCHGRDKRKEERCERNVQVCGREC